LLMDAISHSGGAYFIEKPWQSQDVTTKLEQALIAYKRQALLDHSIRNSLTSSKSALGFLAHELNTPLAIVASYLDMLAHGFKQQALAIKSNPSNPENIGVAAQRWTNQVGREFDPAIIVETLQQQIIYTKDMLNASVQAARMALLEQSAPAIYASELIGSVVQRFAVMAKLNPKVVVEQDFLLNQSIDLIHLAVCSVVQNAIKAMKTVDAPELSIVIGTLASEYSKTPIHFVRISDNGIGVPVQVLSNLNARRPSDSENGAGMGLLFCKRVIESMSGEFLVESHHELGHSLGKGVSTQVTLLCH
jgi:two-component system, response regulator PhcR